MTYNSSRVKSINLRWLYFRSACPSSSNLLNAWIIFRLNNFMIWKMLIKPSQLNIPFTSLYQCNIIWQAMIFIFCTCCMFPYNDDNIVFAGISHMSNITCPKMNDGILTSFQLGVIHIQLQCSCGIFFLNGLLLLSLDLLNDLLIVFHHFLYKLLSYLWEHFFFLSEFSFTDTDDSQDSRGREETIFYSTLPLPPAHEHSDIFLQLCM